MSVFVADIKAKVLWHFRPLLLKIAQNLMVSYEGIVPFQAAILFNIISDASLISGSIDPNSLN